MADSSSTSSKPSKSQRFRSFFKSPASKNYNKVLAESWEKSQADNTQSSHAPPSSTVDKNGDSDDDDLKKPTDGGTAPAPLTQGEKVKALKQKRDAESPSGHFVLGHYRPLNATPGMEDYYTARGLTDSIGRR